MTPPGGAGPVPGEWPLVGRGEEVELLRRLRGSPPRASAVIRGPAGVGKSRLARAVLAEAAEEGWGTLSIRASTGFAGMPLGPFRTVLQIPGSPDLARMTERVTREVAALRSGAGLLVLADDCQDLDDASAGLLHQLVGAGLIVAILTIRSDSTPPAAVTALWKDGLAERLELQSLSRLETAELLSAALGGNVQDSSANRMWHVTGGNPLYLREVVLASRESGALRQVDGEWRWRGQWATGARLQEIVVARLGSLDPDELTAMEMLALAGPLPFGFLTGLTTTRAVEALEARALVTTGNSGRRLEVTIAHRLHAEVLRSGMPALQQRSLRRNLVDALVATGARRTADRIRLACWSLESGVEVDPLTLALGTSASLFGIGQAIGGRLREIMPDVAGPEPPAAPAVPEDIELALRMARAAYERSGGVADGVALVSALGWAGATAEAERVLAELAGRDELADDRLRLALALAWVRFWCRSDVPGAIAACTEALSSAPPGSDPVVLADLHQELAGVALNTARPAEALAHAEAAARAQGVELSASVAAPPAAAALAYLGRCQESLALVDAAVPLAHAGGPPLTVATLLFTRAGALARLGRLDEARRLIEWLREVAVTDGLQDATGIFGVLLGEILLRQGRPASAARIFRDSCGLLAERDLLGYRPWALSGLARSRALCGEEAAAVAALEEARRTQGTGRHFDFSHHMAEVQIHRAGGRSAAAAEAARAGAAWARAAGMPVEEAQAVHTEVCLAPSPHGAARLAELTGHTDSDLVAALAAHAGALVSGDADAALEASARLAGMGACRLAADAAADAARLFGAARSRAARAAERTAAELLARCEGTRPVLPDDRPAPVRLTPREREVAVLAAGGMSSRDIAERMFLSARTVENHLYRVYVKLGITDRSALPAALGSRRTE